VNLYGVADFSLAFRWTSRGEQRYSESRYRASTQDGTTDNANSVLAEVHNHHHTTAVSGMTIDMPPEMRALVDGFLDQAEEVVNEFSGGLEAIPTPPAIYHYTDGTGLRGILQAGKLWFTDIFNLNDPTELRHGFRPAIELLQAEAETGLPEMKQFANNVIAMLQGGIEEIAHFFVCCFSRSSDDLGQWRAYADNGRGFAIGFDGLTPERAFCKPHRAINGLW
jgi:hypothetical protein